MSTQYVTVRIDTSGLYQTASNAVGSVGIIGPAPSAGAGFDNPSVFTRPLTGAGTEPYARVVPVIRVTNDSSGHPVDAANTAIPNVGWAIPLDAHGNPIGPKQLVDSASTAFAPLSVDVNTRTLRRTNGSAFQGASGAAHIVIDGFSIVAKSVSGAAAYYGVPLDVNGQPIPDLIMKPDSDPPVAFEDFSGAALAIDGTLGSSASGSGKPKRADGSPYYKMTLDICALAHSINLALTNGALRVWSYRIDGWDGFSDASPAFTDFANRSIDIVTLSSTSDPSAITALRNHVEASSPNDAGGGGIRPRIGVAMLPEGGITDGTGALTNKFADWKVGMAPSPMTWASSRVTFVVGNTPDDIASAAAGVIAGVDPWVSLVLKSLNGVSNVNSFSDKAVLTYLSPDAVGFVQPRVNPILHPDFLSGSGMVMGEGFTADGSGQRLYIDIVRTIDDLAFRVKALLTNPEVIGTLRINRAGLRVLDALLSGMLSERVGAGEIDDFAIDIPIQAIAEKEPKDRSPAETAQLEAVQNSRHVDLNVSITYAGAIHSIVVTLKFV